MERLRYRLLRANSGALHWVRRRFTPAGRLIVGALIASAVLGLDTTQSMAYQSFTFLLALAALSIAAAPFFRASFTVERVLPRFGTVGQPLPYALRVRNTGGRIWRGLTLREEVADPRPSFGEFSAARSSEDARLYWTDRMLGFSRWRRLLRMRAVASVADVPLPDLPPGASCEAAAELVPARRGRFLLSGVSIARPDPLGLCNSLSSEAKEQTVMILPRRYPVGRPTLPGARRYQQGGVALASAVGDSQEFVSLREYRPGDPLRKIHWRSWAKTGKPIVRENQDEYFVRHALILDTFLGSGREALFEEAVSVAASFASSVLTQESLLDLLFVGSRTFCLTVGRGLGGAERMLEILACVEPCQGKPFTELRESVLLRRPLMSGCIAVLLGWDEPRRELVSALRASRVPVLPLVLMDPAAPAAAQDGGFVRLELGKVAQGVARLP